jgi:hypothetical protein
MLYSCFTRALLQGDALDQPGLRLPACYDYFARRAAPQVTPGYRQGVRSNATKPFSWFNRAYGIRETQIHTRSEGEDPSRRRN